MSNPIFPENPTTFLTFGPSKEKARELLVPKVSSGKSSRTCHHLLPSINRLHLPSYTESQKAKNRAPSTRIAGRQFVKPPVEWIEAANYFDSLSSSSLHHRSDVYTEPTNLGNASCMCTPGPKPSQANLRPTSLTQKPNTARTFAPCFSVYMRLCIIVFHS